jgi:lipoprotein NlpD
VRLNRVLGIVGVSCVLSVGCAASGNFEPQTYVVRPRDTLYSIAWRYDLDYRELARWNNIGADYRIAVGQVLLLRPSHGAPAARQLSNAAPRPLDAPHEPREMPHDVPRVSAPTPLHAAPAASAAAAPTRAAATGAAASGAPAASASKSVVPSASTQWVWPTQRSSTPRTVPGGGILLLGQLGQPVHAACSGRVVYIGSGLRGYGNLIIIKHADNLLSAYAHNRELLVREGQDVAGGQDIARMGNGPHQIAALYFEIRLNGKPVDPLPYLAGSK